MERKRKRQTQLFITTVVTAALFLFVFYIMVSVWMIQTAKGETLQPHNVEDWRPDIKHCFDPEESRELWDCIRHVRD